MPPCNCSTLCLLVRSLLHASLSVDWGLGVMGVSKLGLCTVCVIVVGILVPFRVILFPGICTGVTPKVDLGVTLSPHEILCFGLGVLVIVVAGTVCVDCACPSLLVFDVA
jgi:hypothetical protein